MINANIDICRMGWRVLSIIFLILKRVMDGERKVNETTFLSQNIRYKIEIYNPVLDQIISSISSRFEGTRQILADYT